MQFLSTPSARRATPLRQFQYPKQQNFYPRPPRGGRLAKLAGEVIDHAISIHALREEGDDKGGRESGIHANFYPRPPRGGRPAFMYDSGDWAEFLSTPSARRATREGQTKCQREQFLSTPSARRATYQALEPREKVGNFYPRPPRGGRHGCEDSFGLLRGISIHALREEGDLRLRRGHPGHGRISIHALREEGDSCRAFFMTATTNFYPRPPRGGRHPQAVRGHGGHQISIHALREEGDHERNADDKDDVQFLSTPSARRATRQ